MSRGSEDLPTRFKVDCLSAVGQRDAPSGADIQDELQTVYGVAVNNGRLYQSLDELTETGLLSKGDHVDDARKNKYQLTADGRDLLRRRIEWLSEGLPVAAEGTPIAPDGGER